MRFDELGDRMKLFEDMEAGRKLMPGLPALARIDGRAFHTFTKGMERPYDKHLSDAMIETTKYLVKETNACVGYTQSDEISLAWYEEPYSTSEIFFNGRIHKMVSQLSSLTTLYFHHCIKAFFANDPQLYVYLNREPTFDARVWNVPNLGVAADVFRWRELDATRNSISMAAQSRFSHSQLMNKNCSQMQDMLHEVGINWNDYEAFFKRGVYVQRLKVLRPFTFEEIDKLPLKHYARTNPDLQVERTEYITLDMPPCYKIINLPQVLFYGAPVITSDGKLLFNNPIENEKFCAIDT